MVDHKNGLVIGYVQIIPGMVESSTKRLFNTSNHHHQLERKLQRLLGFHDQRLFQH
jgi:hypothetical protein